MITPETNHVQCVYNIINLDVIQDIWVRQTTLYILLSINAQSHTYFFTSKIQ